MWFDFRLGQDVKGAGEVGDEVVKIEYGEVEQSDIHPAVFWTGWLRWCRTKRYRSGRGLSV